jgi:hypothetical protein
MRRRRIGFAKLATARPPLRGGVVYTWTPRPTLRGGVVCSWLLAVSPLALSCGRSAPSSAAPRPPISASDWVGARDQASASAPAPPVRKGAWTLHIGDSFVHASLQQNLGPRFHATGTGYVVDATTATYTTTWSSDPDLDQWLSRRPSLVLVTLGANEVDMTVPEEHAGAVAHLVRRIHEVGASCVWIAPPLWKKDSGILQVIHDHCAPCLFFDSDAVLGGLQADERQRDGIHPNKKGGARWAGAFWDWLADHRDPTSENWGLLPFEVRTPSPT